MYYVYLILFHLFVCLYMWKLFLHHFLLHSSHVMQLLLFAYKIFILIQSKNLYP